MKITCPKCGAILHCPCPECKKTEPADALHYLYVSGEDGQPDKFGCPECCFSGGLAKWVI